jgi:modulator of FtsH protease HflK
MAWNQPGGNNSNNPWGKKPASGGGDLDQAFKDWQKRVESLFGGSGRSGSFVVVLLAIIVAIWMATGFYTVNVGSQGVVQRFGRHVATVPNGWGWRFPWPIEQVTEVNTSRVTPTSYKSSVLTAEPNMVELEIAVQYRIRDPEDYLFRVRDPEITLGEVSESAIREVVGRSDQQAILESKRVEIADATRDIVQRTLDAYGAGMEVMEVKITGVQVPEAVQQSQRDSVKAKADRERVTREATAYSNEILPKAEGAAKSCPRPRAPRRARYRKRKPTSRRSCSRPPAMPHASTSWSPPMRRRRGSPASACTSRRWSPCCATRAR